MENVNFKYGTQEQYDSIAPDEHTFYKVDQDNTSEDEDPYDVYLGDVKLNNGNEIKELQEELSLMINFEELMIKNTPFCYEREYLPTSDKTSITIYANTQVNINGEGYYTTQDIVLSTSGVAEAGKDVYIYACMPTSGTTPDFVLSQNSTVPSGYTENTSRKIGGFHCLCADVGTISGHDLSGYKAGEILPASIWDLKHRPVSDPEGMVYDEGTGRWYDIYLASWNGSKFVSAYGASVTSGTTTNPFHGLKFKEYMGKQGKRLLWRHEFMCVAKGSNENTAIQGAANPVTTGGHVDSEGRRMISNIGLEDCCGCFWQWVNDEYEHYAYGTSSSDQVVSRFNQNNTNAYFDGYGWMSSRDSEGLPRASYNASIDDQMYGDTYGMPRQALVGARWGNSSYCGSRAVYANRFGSLATGNYGARGASEPRVA